MITIGPIIAVDDMVFKVLKCNDCENKLKLSVVWEGHIRQSSINIIMCAMLEHRIYYTFSHLDSLQKCGDTLWEAAVTDFNN